ncbi:MAG TPA: hypothetical protein VN893_24070 [Bryobacteraceae bacterium]|nr:hypothetical protein [Bryobacteraceae bacterium]
MAGAISGVMAFVQILQVIFVYGMLAVMLLMLYKVSKEVADLKRALTDMEERLLLAMLPKEAKADRAERL